MEADDVVEAVVRPRQHRQALQAFRAGDAEDLAAPVDQPVVAPARERLLLIDNELDRIRPALARLDALHPRQLRHCSAHRGEIDREEPVAEMRRNRGADLLGADVVELRAHVELGHRPAVGREPAVQHADDRQSDQRQRDAPGDELEEERAFHRPPPSESTDAPESRIPNPGSFSNVDSKIRQHSVSKSMPTALAAFGTSE